MLKIVALLCRISNPSDCHEQVVTTVEQSGVSLQGCMAGGPALASFMEAFPQYRLAKWKCIAGERGQKI